MSQKKKQTFEELMTRLEQIVHALETGEAPLEESLRLYEEGIALVRDCTERLDSAEQKIRALNPEKPDKDASKTGAEEADTL